MEYRLLGRSGLRVSKLCLGTMRGFNRKSAETAQEVLDQALDGGVNFVDTADCYGRGESETAVGNALAANGRRDEVVLATKAGWFMGKNANDYGYSRKHLIEACENSLRRLQTDYIDLYILHVVDPNTPLDELLYTCDILARSGKVRYFGTSKHPASKIVEGVMTSNMRGYPRFVSEQPPYNLLDRSAENELIPACRQHGVGITPFYPIASGLLAGKYRKGEAPPAGSRLAGKVKLGDEIFNENALDAVGKLEEIARDKGVAAAELAVAWLMQQPGVTSAVLGARTPEYVQSGLAACEVTLSSSELAAIDRIVPPGRYVSNYFAPNVYAPLRRNYDADARQEEKTGAYVPRTDSMDTLESFK